LSTNHLPQSRSVETQGRCLSSFSFAAVELLRQEHNKKDIGYFGKFEGPVARDTLSVLVTMSLRIVLADDSPPLLQRVISVLQHDFQVVATANNGNSALECVQQHDPDVIVLDVSMPPPNGIEVSRILHKSGARVKIVILTSHQDRMLVQAALEAGALGYVSKDRISEDLIAAIRSAAQGTPFVSSS